MTKIASGTPILTDDSGNAIGMKHGDGSEHYFQYTDADGTATALSSSTTVTAGTGVIVGTETYILKGDGAPVDYTDGDPAATGEGVTGIGSIYIDVTNGKLYVNGGTKAQPTWKLVTSAA